MRKSNSKSKIPAGSKNLPQPGNTNLTRNHYHPRSIMQNLYNRLPPAVPLAPPTVDYQLEKLPWINRAAEMLRYTFLSLEYSLSPQGRLRQWIKLNALLFLWMAIPIFLFMPIGVFLFGELATITEFMNVCISNLVQSLIPTFTVVVVLSVLVLLVKRS